VVSGYESFDNTEMNFRKDALIQERVGLVSTHMYKEYLDYQNATINTVEVFKEIIDDLKLTVDSLKKSFTSRGLPHQTNIHVDFDTQKTVVTLDILWHTISLTTRCNFMPQALYRENQQPFPCGRIMAIKGNYNELMRDINDKNKGMEILLDNEIASLYVPADKMQNSILKIKPFSNREFPLTAQDSAKEFALKVIEIVCGNVIYHEEGSRKSFNI
jgi:hypothetical protein